MRSWAAMLVLALAAVGPAAVLAQGAAVPGFGGTGTSGTTRPGGGPTAPAAPVQPSPASPAAPSSELPVLPQVGVPAGGSTPGRTPAPAAQETPSGFVVGPGGTTGVGAPPEVLGATPGGTDATGTPVEGGGAPGTGGVVVDPGAGGVVVTPGEGGVVLTPGAGGVVVTPGGADAPAPAPAGPPAGFIGGPDLVPGAASGGVAPVTPAPVGQATPNSAGNLTGRGVDTGTGLPGQASGPPGAVSGGLPGAPANAVTPSALPGSPGLPGGVGSTPNNLTPGAAVAIPDASSAGSAVPGTTFATPGSPVTPTPGTGGFGSVTSVAPPSVVAPPPTPLATVSGTECLRLQSCFEALDRDLCLYDDPSCGNAFVVPESVDEPKECAQMLSTAPTYAVMFAAGRSEYDIPSDCR